MQTSAKKLGLLVVLLSLAGGVGCVGSYNKLVQLSQAVDAQWAQVQNAYQRRADLVPNLVETVKGAAKFEQSTMIAVTEARAKVGQVQAAAGVERRQRSGGAAARSSRRRTSCRRRCRGCWSCPSSTPT